MTRFWKLHGLGNDFIFTDPGAEPTPEFIRLICHRVEGVGSDGFIVVEALEPGIATMRMWNPDGSESGMCGNGLRCAARYLRHVGFSEPEWSIQLGGGSYRVKGAGPYTVEMGTAKTLWDQREYEVGNQTLRGSAIDVGNPHLVFFVEGELEPYLAYGPELETHPDFPNRTNVHFAREDADGIHMVTWERGAGATHACGSGACSVAVARGGADHLVHLPGGDLRISHVGGFITMTGPAELVFEGEWPD